jgi:Domain of unknown function (DUF4394)/Calx-beta domain
MKNLLRSLLAKRRRPTRGPKPRLKLELLESRLTPANLDISATGAAAFTANPAELNDVSLFLNTGTGRYEFTDAGAVITVSGAGAGPAFADAQGAGTNTVTVKSAFITSIAIDTDDLSDFVTIRSTAVPTSVTSTGGNDTVRLGDAGSVQGITAAVTVSNPAALTDLVIDDSTDATGRTVTLSDSSVTGLAPAALNFTSTDIGSLTVSGGTGGNSFTVTNTLFSSTTTLNAGTGNDTVVVQAGGTGSTLNVNGQGGADDFTVTPSASATFNFDGGPPTTANGDTLTYLGAGTVNPAGPGAGTITQTGFTPVTFNNVENVFVSGAGTLQFSAPSFNAAENAGTVTLTVTRTGGNVGTVMVNVATRNGTASAGSDYLATVGTLIFAPADTSKQVTIPLLDDNLVEGLENFSVVLSTPTGGAQLGTQSTATVNLFDDETPGVTLLGLTSANELVTFDSNTPGTFSSTTAVTGLQAGESLLGIDFRPANGLLYGVGSTGRLYTINPATGAATQVGPGTFAVPLSGTAFGVDFNPAVDRLRVVSDADLNLRINPDTAAVVDGDPNTAGTQPDTPLAYTAGEANTGQNPNVVGEAYTNNFAGTTSTTLYGIDSNLDLLVLQGSPGGAPTSPNSGQLFTVGPLGVNTSDLVGFDIAADGTAFAALTVNGVSGLYAINLTTGAAALVANFTGPGTVRGLTAIPPQTVQFSAPTVTVAENAGSATVTVTRISGTGTVSVNVATSNGTATAGSASLSSVFFPPPTQTGDYGPVTTTLTFGPGETSKTVTIPIRDDGRAESNETINLTLSNATGGAALGFQKTAVVTITDDDQGQSANQRFLNQAYLDVLGRPVDPSGLASFGALLAAGVPRTQVVRMLEASDEYRTLVVQQVFQKLLGRAADPGGLNNFTAALRAGATIQQVEASVAASPEYFQNRGGGTQAGFINAIFQDALGRSAGQDAVTLFGNVPQAQVAAIVFGSEEYNGAVVGNFYQRFLQRGPDGGGFIIFSNALTTGTRIEDVIAQIVGSEEYFGNL